MSDFEGRVTEALRDGSEAAPDALGLADAARGRARDRRRTRVAAVAAGAVVALAVPVGVVALSGGDGPGRTPVVDDPASVAPAPAGRWESWHGLTVKVPDGWQYGALTTWCIGDPSPDRFKIFREGGVVEDIACSPLSTFGLMFQAVDMKETDEPFDWPVVGQTGDTWPTGTFVGAHGEDGVLVEVAGPDRQQVLDILATVTVIDGVDANGCPATDDDSVVGDGDSVSVCRFTADGVLLQSERLTGSDADDARAAVSSAPTMDFAPPCAPPVGEPAPIDEYVVMVDGATHMEVGYQGDTCPSQGVFIGDSERHTLTPDILFWALSPGWSGSVGPDVPLPTALRSYDPEG